MKLSEIKVGQTLSGVTASANVTVVAVAPITSWTSWTAIETASALVPQQKPAAQLELI
ncbi:MAG: hypothetical protein Q8N26_28910 [Myxococcales bacterium]|nr:hypothetical protein [Myxococcales bacterium]